jgi:hypothetical protein
MKVNQTALECFLRGSHITDAEAKELLVFFTDLEESLRVMGTEYHFPWRESYHNRNRLEDYISNRKRNKE